jgi:23S rRNA pseudouridine1911/1915/1917 synthase
MNILYEDNHLLVVEKPVNMPVQADMSGDADLLSAAKAYIKQAYHKPGEAYLGLVHRLDRPVGGVMVFARTSKAAARLSAQFAAGRAQKRYAAIVCGQAESEAVLNDWLLKDETSFSSAVVEAGTPGAKSAKLSYALLGRQDGRALLDIRLFTGRPHQIRVQLMHAGLPIAGDQRYNPGASPGEQIKLWAYALTLVHPTLGEEMCFTCLPHGEGWDFAAQLEALPAFRVCRGVYRDEELLVVDKNKGVEVEEALLGELSSLYGDVRPLHRLDANTEGLVAFARNEAAERRLLAAFMAREPEKTYHAIVRGAIQEPGALVHMLQKDAAEANVRIVEQDAPGAMRAALSYRPLATDGEKSLVEISLETGRTHQIRVQMAAIGHPVLGDDKYGDRAFNRAQHAKTQCLLAKRLKLEGRQFESCRELRL